MNNNKNKKNINKNLNKKNNNNLQFKYKHNYLYDKMVKKELIQEQNILLQAFRFFIEENLI